MAAVVVTLFMIVLFVTFIPALVSTFGIMASMDTFGVGRGFKIFIRDNKEMSIMGAIFYVTVVLAWFVYMEMTHGIQWC